MCKVSVVIPTMPGREDMVERLKKTIPQKYYDVIVVGGTDRLLAAKRNAGAMYSTGEYILFIDDDNYLAPGAIEAALELAEQPGVGVVGMVACYDDKQNLIADGGSKRNYTTGFTTGMNTNEDIKNVTENYEVDEVANAFMMHSELYTELYGLDEKHFPIDLDEADFCKRAKNKGYKIMMCPMAKCYHHSQTYSPIPDFRRPLNAYYMGRNKIIYQKKHLHPIKYMIYLIGFFWVTMVVYTASLLYRRKPKMIYYFYKGIFHGLSKRVVREK